MVSSYAYSCTYISTMLDNIHTYEIAAMAELLLAKIAVDQSPVSEITDQSAITLSKNLSKARNYIGIYDLHNNVFMSRATQSLTRFINTHCK